MSFIEENLIDGEKVSYQGKLHWIVLFWPIFWLVVTICVFAVVGDQYYLGKFCILAVLITGASPLFRFATSEYGITNKRVIVKTGIFSIDSTEVMINKIEDVQVHQGFLGWIVGYGSITIVGTGGTKDPLTMISSPLEFRKKLQEQISAC